MGKRSSYTLPPVGGAQQSQVAVGGTEALVRQEEEVATGQQLASVCLKTGWKKQGQVKSKRFLLYQWLPKLFHIKGSQGDYSCRVLTQGRKRMCGTPY